MSRLMNDKSPLREQRSSDDEQRRSLDRVIPLVVGVLPIEQSVSIDNWQWERNLETYFAFGRTHRRVGLDEVVFEFSARLA